MPRLEDIMVPIPPTLTCEQLFCLEGCRSQKQYTNLHKSFEKGACAFCQLDRSFHKVLWKDDNVMVWKVPEDYLRETLKLHTLVVPKRHVRFEADLRDDEALSVHRGKQFVHTTLDYRGGLCHVREGDMRLNAGTVPHLHYNIFEPNLMGEVRIPVFKNPSGRQTNAARGTVFATQYESEQAP